MNESSPKTTSAEPAQRGNANEKTALALATFLSIAGAERELQAAEIEPSMSFEQGMEILRESALNDDVEKDAYFIIDNTGTRWSIQATSILDKEGSPIIKRYPEDVDQLVSAETQKVMYVHTHPAQLIIQSSEENSELDRLPMSELSKAPSQSDIVFNIRTNTLLEKHGIEYQSMVIDPSGTWNVAIENGHPIHKLINEYREITLDLSQELLSGDFATEETIKEKIQQLTFYQSYTKTTEQYGEKIGSLVESLHKTSMALSMLHPLVKYSILTQNFSERVAEDPVQTRTDIINHAKQDGVKLTFTPFEQQAPLKVTGVSSD
jgi:hypothetical protein